MGILDEAIREHLALKRRQGLSDDELKRLEDEAFGPPARPGEPDFPAGEGEQADNGDAEAAPEDEEAGLEAASGQPSLERPDLEPIGVGDEGMDVREPRAVEEGEDELEEPEAGPRSGPATDEQEAPAVEDLEGGDAESEATAVYDRGDEELDLGELERELDLEEEREAAAPDRGAAPAAAEAEEAEPPIESPETVEHPMHEELAEDEADEFEASEADELEAPGAEEPPADESGEHQPEGYEQGAAGDAGEDVLEETPDFLRDAPEDDELWFEQGEPKDFDF